MSFLRTYRYELLLLIVLFAAAVLRLYTLDSRGLWYDELHTAMVSDPAISWSKLLSYMKLDTHPPLFFIIERVGMQLFGTSEFSVRLVAVLFGLAGIFAVYQLGKEIQNKALGLLAAAFAAVNTFHIYFSQEARMYSLLFFLACYSYIALLRLCSTLSFGHAAFFVVINILLIYTHYYGLFLFVAETLFAIVFFLNRPLQLKRAFWVFSVCGSFVLLGNLPLLSNYQHAAALKVVWLRREDPLFFLHYYYDYFGAQPLLIPFLLILPCLFVRHTYHSIKQRAQFYSGNPPVLLALLTLITCVCVYAVPYVRSLTSAPILMTRYTIVILPLFLLIMARGSLSLKPAFRSVAIVGFLSVSLYSLAASGFYTRPARQQFREMTEYVAGSGTQYPLIDDRMGDFLRYYLRMFKYEAPVLSGNRERILDSVLRLPPSSTIMDTFWLVGGHDEKPLSGDVRNNLDTMYVLLKERQYADAWAQLYAKRN